tara:strand:+ start:128 stop:499 length:372 start_codon:yes stop_codon:yes gene_type:complete
MNKQSKEQKQTTIISKEITDLMVDKKAIDVTLIDVRKITPLTDYFILCTSESDPQTRAIFNHIKDTLSEKNIKPWKTEGYEYLQWVVMDYINFVVHIFNKDNREYYDFERLWGDAKITKIKNT